jgi:hypothetical protein
MLFLAAYLIFAGLNKLNELNMLFLAAYLSLAGLVVACGRLKKRGKPNLA